MENIAVRRIVLHQPGGIHADCTGHTCALWDTCGTWAEFDQLVLQRAAKMGPRPDHAECTVTAEWVDGRTHSYKFTLRRDLIQFSAHAADRRTLLAHRGITGYDCGETSS